MEQLLDRTVTYCQKKYGIVPINYLVDALERHILYTENRIELLEAIKNCSRDPDLQKRVESLMGKYKTTNENFRLRIIKILVYEKSIQNSLDNSADIFVCPERSGESD